ncbi:SusC/RagA family TonB-linked outer membrane protein [Bacteroides heparinolyticus]|uniref:SusC/RagA family TonB-linked outer membrane protein n=1 Tax=Prevotella heparinolytica TaxID=28113 RepID=UPI0035A10094
MKKVKKYKLLMIALLLLFVAGWQSKAMIAPPDGSLLSLRLEAVSTRTFFETLKAKTGLSFVYSTDISAIIGSVTITVENATIDEVLQKVLSPKGLLYSIKDEIVSITKQTTNTKTRYIIGRVTDADGEPLPGVTVNAPSVKNYALTDNDGYYRIDLPRGIDVTVTYSYVGMTPENKTFPKGGSDLVYDVVLKSSTELTEVVVTGIFNRTSGSFTGSAATISSQDILKAGNQNVIQSLKNIDPTLQIGDNLLSGSDPNSLPDLSMRGTSSLPSGEVGNVRNQYSNQPNQPLFILDGFETSLATIMDMDMNRIESVTILKDASAKAIYGSKAANGVIVIETKKLKGNEQRITYNGGLSLEIPDLSSYNLTNSLEKLDVEMADGYYSGLSLETTQARLKLYNARKKKALEGLNTYWLAKPLRTGIGHKHNISIELGDSENLRAIVDFTYNLVNGAMKGSERQNISTSANVSYRTKKFVFRNILTYLNNASNDSPYGTFSSYAHMNPYWEATDASGNILRWADSDEKIPNPMYDATIGTSLKKNYTQFTDNLYAEWNASENIRATLRFGVTQNKSGGDLFYPAAHSMFSAGGGTSDLENRGRYTLTHGNMLQTSGDLNVKYSKSLGDHYFFINGGAFISEMNSNSYQHVAEGFSNNDMADITFARRYLEGSKPAGSSSRNREASFLIASSYDYANRYMIDATIRKSASSLYGSNNRWANSWSLGIGWNLHNEAWMKSFKSLKQLKIRASAGLTGNQNFDTNAAIATYHYYTGVVYDGLTGAYLKNMPNPDLKWEQKMDYNFGLDARIYGLNLSLDIYRSDTKNMLTDLTIPTSTGFGIVKENLGLVRNVGGELKVSYNVYQNKNGFWSLFGTIATNKNHIVRLSESLKSYNETIKKNTSLSTEAVSRPVILYEDGRSMSTIWAVPSAGIDPGRGTEIYIKQDGSFTYEYDPTDLQPLGDSNPKYRGNFGFNAEYKGLGLNVTFTFLSGGQIYNSTLVGKVENANIKYNVDKRLAEGRWRNPGEITRFKRYKNSKSTRPTSRFIQDRNELHISSVSLYYNIPSKWYKKMGMNQLRVSLYMNDLVTFSSVQIERGTSYPFARKLSMSLTAAF